MRPSTVAAMLMVIAGACAPRPPPPHQSTAPVVEVAEIGVPDAMGTVRIVGVITHEREMALAFRVQGVLVAAPAQVGDVVERGSIVGRLNSTALTAAASQTTTELDRANRDLQRDRRLFDRGFVSQQRIQDAESAVRVAEAAHQSAVFEEASATLHAPARAVVLERLAEVGEVVQPGQPILRISDLASPVLLRAAIADRDASRLRLGDQATITVEGRTERLLSGRVVRIGRMVDARTGAVLVDIALSAQDPQLRSGQVAAASVQLQAANVAEGVEAIPVEAIISIESDRALIMLVGPDGRVRNQTLPFRGLEGEAALVSGLAPGARVITAGAGLLKDGQIVRVARKRSVTRPEGPPG